MKGCNNYLDTLCRLECSIDVYLYIRPRASGPTGVSIQERKRDPPPGLGLWGQTADKQTTNKPENQQSNEPTDQQTNKPTRQQTNTTTSNKSRSDPPNQPKKVKNHNKNDRTNIHKNKKEGHLKQ